MLNDLRYAWRALRANRLFTAMAVLSLALGIGANTAIYSFMDAILLRQLPVDNPDSLVTLQWHARDNDGAMIVSTLRGWLWTDPELGRVSPNLPYRVFETMSADNPVLASVAAFDHAWRITPLIRQQGSAVPALYVSGHFFGTLGLRTVAGRPIGPEDDREGAAPVAVVSYAFAQRRFGDPARALGETAVINDVPFTIVGVTPAGFTGMRPGVAHEFYLPQHASILVERIYGGDSRAKYADARNYWCEIVGRLRPGVTREQAQAALAARFQQFASSEAANDAERSNLPQLQVVDGSRGLGNLRREYAKPLFFLMTLVGLILAIACANLANLLLARSAGRRCEMAVRLSLGAGKLRIVRQLLTESLLLAVLGAGVGLLFAHWGVQGLTVFLAGSNESFVLDVGLNLRVLAVAAGLAVVTGLLFGLAPALQSTRVDLTTALKQTRAGEARRRLGGWLRISVSQSLVVAQVAVSLLLLVSAGLFVRTLSKLISTELGFNRERLLVFAVDARQAGYREPALRRFCEDLRTRLASIPGVRSASASNFPLVSDTVNGTEIAVPGYTVKDAESSFLSVAPDFFRTLEIPVLLGRPIDARDVSRAAKVAVVNEVFARKYLAGQNPVGRRFSVRENQATTEFEIVGVARNARYSSLKDDIPPVAYLPYTYDPRVLGALTFELRTAGDPMAFAAAAREVVRQADSRIPVTELRSQEAVINETIGQERAFAILCTAFALLAVAIACVGLYGTMAYSVARRTNEIGLRMALGAERRRLIWMVLREVLVMAGAGLAIGIPAALATTKFVESFLYGLKPNDPWAIAGAVFVLVVAAVAAGLGPARRASKIDPWTALRHE